MNTKIPNIFMSKNNRRSLVPYEMLHYFLFLQHNLRSYKDTYKEAIKVRAYGIICFSPEQFVREEIVLVELKFTNRFTKDHLAHL